MCAPVVVPMAVTVTVVQHGDPGQEGGAGRADSPAQSQGLGLLHVYDHGLEAGLDLAGEGGGALPPLTHPDTCACCHALGPVGPAETSAAAMVCPGAGVESAGVESLGGGMGSVGPGGPFSAAQIVGDEDLVRPRRRARKANQ